MKNKIYIEDIPDDIKILENTKIFNVLLKAYSIKVGKIISVNDFKHNLFLVEDFDNYIRSEALTGELKVSIKKSEIKKAEELISNFKKRYGLLAKGSDAYYMQVRNILYGTKRKTPEEWEKIKKDMGKFLAAYHMVKRVFEETYREGLCKIKGIRERYFNHLTGTMNIVLNELPNPNINTIVMALLHDCIEDIEGIDYVTIESIFGEEIARGVEKLSKKELEEYYLSKHQKKQIKKNEKEGNKDRNKGIIAEAKKIRVEDYFGHLDDLSDDILTVKFADRIHNLRTLDGLSQEKIIKKIGETEKYFYPVAKRRNMVAYNLMKKEIDNMLAKINSK